MKKLSLNIRIITILFITVLGITTLSTSYLSAKEKPNNPPVAKFRVEKNYVVQGERVEYIDESYDPDGDKIVEVKWTGKLPIFFQPGVKKVTLQVKDSRGLWSEPAEVTITVWQKSDLFSFNKRVKHAKIGEVIDLTMEEPLSFPTLTPIVRDWGPTLLLSNSPEVIKQNGILYADKALGNVRLYYYHLNGVQEKKRIYILAENLSEGMATVDIYRDGSAKPNANALMAGKMGLQSYFSSPVDKRFVINPGETIVLNPEGSSRSMAYGQVAHEVMDVFTDVPVRFSFVVVGEKDNVLTKYKEDMLILSRDNHPRGTFTNANRSLEIQVDDLTKKRFILADNKQDAFLVGKDNLTGQPSINRGNYGLLYQFTVNSQYKVGLVTAIRGGAFCGAFVATDGKVYFTPKEGVLKSSTEGGMNGFFTPNAEQKMLFMVPVASFTPVNMLVIPIQE